MKKLLATIIAFTFILTIIPAVPVTSAQAADIYVRVLIEPILEFDELGIFSEGLAAAEIDNKWGLINKTGKIVVPIEYGWIESFSEGLALANKGGGFSGSSMESTGIAGGSWGFIDKTGKTVIPFEYDYLSHSFREGFAAVKKGDKWGYINKKGQIVAPIEYAAAQDFSEGLAVVMKRDYPTNKFSYINKNGNVVISLEYQGPSSFSEGLACMYKGAAKDAKYGYIDKSGTEVIPFQYDYSTDFSEGFAMVGKIGKKSQIIDKTGSTVVTLKALYWAPSKFIDGLIVAATENWKWGVIDTEGNTIVRFGYYDSISDFSQGFAVVSKDGKYGYIDTTGKEVVPLEYSLARDFNEGLAAVRIGMQPNCKWGILELTNKKPSPSTPDPISEAVESTDDAITKPWDNASQWAISELEKANALGLIPAVLHGSDMTKPITRAEFAAVSVKLYEKLSGKKASPAPENTFKDTTDTEVLKAFNIGITNGYNAAGDMFEPDILLNRETASTMLTRVWKKYSISDWTLMTDGNFTLEYNKPESFKDDDKISAWAKESVYFMAANKIVLGDSGNFKPRNTNAEEEAVSYANATREQALIIAVRICENLKK